MNTFVLNFGSDEKMVFFSESTSEEIWTAYFNACEKLKLQFHEHKDTIEVDRNYEVLLKDSTKLSEDAQVKLIEAGCPFRELHINDYHVGKLQVPAFLTWFILQGAKENMKITVLNEDSTILNYIVVKAKQPQVEAVVHEDDEEAVEDEAYADDEDYDEVDGFDILTIGNVFKKNSTVSAYGTGRINIAGNIIHPF